MRNVGRSFELPQRDVFLYVAALLRHFTWLTSQTVFGSIRDSLLRKCYKSTLESSGKITYLLLNNDEGNVCTGYKIVFTNVHHFFENVIRCEFLGSNPTATALSGFPRHEMTSAVNVALNKHSN